MDNIVIPKGRFQEFDWSRLAVEPPGSGRWSIGRGGHGCPDHDWFISLIVNDDLDQEIWVLPDAFQHILEVVERTGRDKVQREVAHHLAKLFEIANIELP